MKPFRNRTQRRLVLHTLAFHVADLYALDDTTAATMIRELHHVATPEDVDAWLERYIPDNVCRVCGLDAHPEPDAERTTVCHTCRDVDPLLDVTIPFRVAVPVEFAMPVEVAIEASWEPAPAPEGAFTKGIA